MRSVMVSVEVFAALWANRRPGEDDENAILERLLGLPERPVPSSQATSEPALSDGTSAGTVKEPAALKGAAQPLGGAGKGGIYNKEFDVHFPPGFEVFRVHKDRQYRAVVQNGRWVMDGEVFPSLVALSAAVINSPEDPWIHWKHRRTDGRVEFIVNLQKIPQAPDKAESEDEKDSPPKLLH